MLAKNEKIIRLFCYNNFMEKTLCLLKPDILERNLVGVALKELEDNKFKITKINLINFGKTFKIDEKTHKEISLAAKFYEMFSDKGWFPQFLIFCEKPIVALELEKKDAIPSLRKLMGATNPEQAEIGTLRYKYALSIDQNSFHGSDSIEAFERESKIIFG